MAVVAVFNRKGGVGKTVICVHLAAGFFGRAWQVSAAPSGGR